MTETDLTMLYIILSQFPNVSVQSNSSRAVRAREKILQISSGRFQELGTDVHDELKRRINSNTTGNSPDYLLPNSSMCPKRNQARRKMSSLPQSRFRDLASDIWYEIERRGYLQKKLTPQENI